MIRWEDITQSIIEGIPIIHGWEYHNHPMVHMVVQVHEDRIRIRIHQIMHIMRCEEEEDDAVQQCTMDSHIDGKVITVDGTMDSRIERQSIIATQITMDIIDCVISAREKMDDFCIIGE